MKVSVNRLWFGYNRAMKSHAEWCSLAFAFVAACSADPGTTCGTGSASPTIDVVAASTTLTYGELRSSVANDCSDTTSGIISLTIQSTQVGGAGVFALCIVRPDKLASGQALGTDVRVVDAGAQRLA